MESPNLIPLNGTKLCIFAMRRSGSHAFLNWLTTLYPGKVCFINDVSRKSKIVAEQQSEDLPALHPGKRAALNEPKQLLLYNYEDLDLAENGNQQLQRTLEGTSGYEWTILLLRDPYNLFASRLELRKRMPRNGFALEVAPPHEAGIIWQRNLWLQYAKEFLEETRYLKGNVLRVSYNHWVLYETYRRDICRKLNGCYNEKSLNQVTKYGFGSSFDKDHKTSVENRGDLMNRWRNFTNDLEYAKILADPEIDRLSLTIFGEIRR